MIQAYLFAAAAAAMALVFEPPTDKRLAEARYAIEAGRLGQAESMVADLVAGGVEGEGVDRLRAELAFASADNHDALIRYMALLKRRPDDQNLLERAAISALRAGFVREGKVLADRAVVAPNASWRAWNARGVAADLEGDSTAADHAYSRAIELAPDQPEILNNLGWSHLQRGDWVAAAGYFEKAAALMPGSPRVLNNLALARAALAADLPIGRAGESATDWASRLNDAGVAAQMRGDTARAVAAYSRALVARTSWYQRAADNLRSIQGR